MVIATMPTIIPEILPLLVLPSIVIVSVSPASSDEVSEPSPVVLLVSDGTLATGLELSEGLAAGLELLFSEGLASGLRVTLTLGRKDGDEDGGENGCEDGDEE